MDINSDTLSPIGLIQPSQLLYSASQSSSTKPVFNQQRRSESVLPSEPPSRSQLSLGNRLSASAIVAKSPTGDYENVGPRPRLQPRYYRRSVGVLPITQSTPSKALILSPTWKHPHAQSSLILVPATLPDNSNFALSSPLTLKQPMTSAMRTSRDAKFTQSTTHPQAAHLAIEDLTPRGPQNFDSSLHTEIPRHKKPAASSSSPRLYSLLTPSAYRSKHRPSPKMKSSFFSALNKSEPHLSSNSTSRAKPSPISNKCPQDSVEVLDKSNQPRSPLISELSPSLLTQAPSPTLINGDLPRLTTSPNLQHQKMKSIINNTSRRISIFTSRLNHSSAASRMVPNANRDSATTSDISNPRPLPNHTVETSLLSVIPSDNMSRSTAMHSESSANKANASNSSRIHSPGFYQSLKMRWKPEHSSRSVLLPSPTNSTPATKEIEAQTFSNYEKLKRSQKLAIPSFDGFLPPQFPLPQRSSRISLAEFLTSKNPKRSDTCEDLETIASISTDHKPVCTLDSKKMTPRPPQTHISPRPRAASTSSTVSTSTSDPLTSFVLQGPESRRRFSHLKPLQLQVESLRRRPLSTPSQVEQSKVKEEVKFQNGLHPEINLAISALSSSGSLDSITDNFPQSLAGRSSVIQQHDLRGTELPRVSLLTASPVMSESTPARVFLKGTQKRDSTGLNLGPSVQRKLRSEKYDNDLMTFLLPSSQMGLDKSNDPLDLIDPRLLDIPLTMVSDHPIGTTYHYLEVHTRGRPSLENGGGRKAPQVARDTHKPTDLVTECSSSLLAENLHHTNYKSSDSRRSSITSVLNRKDSLGSSTPELFQGIWEKELEENERKWKRLARLSDSRMGSEDLTSCDILQAFPIMPLTVKGDLATKSSNAAKRLSLSGIKPSTHKHSSHLGATPMPITLDTTTDSDCLSKIWDSFKSEADISLSELTYDATLNDDLGGKLDHIDHYYIPEETELLIEQKPLLKTFASNSCNHSSSSKAEVVGLGLVDVTSNSYSRFDVISFTQSCHVPAPAKHVTSKSSVGMHKQKKLSLSSDESFKPPPSSSTSTNVQQTCAIKTAGPLADDSFTQNSILDLSLVNAFPTPPKGHRSSLSSSSSHSSKSLLCPRKNRTRLSLIARCESNELMFTDLSLRMRKTSLSIAGDLSNPRMLDVKAESPASSKPSNDFLERTVHQPRSFSNRPRAQSGFGRAPPPAPIQIFTSSQSTSASSAKTVSSGKTRRRSLGVTAGKNNSSHSMRSPIYMKPPAPPPNVPLPLEPGRKLHSPADNPESKHLNKKNLASSSSQSNLSPGALNPGSLSPGSLSPGGLTVKRPSLVIRPKLTSSRSGGIYPTSGPSRSLSQANVTTFPTNISTSPTNLTQDTRSFECGSPIASERSIVDLHHYLVDQTKDTTQSSSSHATCSSLFSSIGNSSISTTSTISSPCTPSSTRHNYNHYIPPVPLTHSFNSPNLISHRLGRVLLSPPSLIPFAFTEPSQLLTTPRTAISKLEQSKPPTPRTIKPSIRSFGPPSPPAEQRFRSTNRRFPRSKNDLLSPTGPSAISSPKPLNKSEWVSYGMAM